MTIEDSLARMFSTPEAERHGPHPGTPQYRREKAAAEIMKDIDKFCMTETRGRRSEPHKCTKVRKLKTELIMQAFGLTWLDARTVCIMVEKALQDQGREL